MKLTIVVVQSTGALAVNETCIVQVHSQPGGDASVNPMVVTTGADGEATATLFVGSTPGAIEVSAQCGDAPTAVITLTVGGASVPPSGPASLPDAGTGSFGGLNDPFGLWPILMLAISGALIAAAGFLSLRREPQLQPQALPVEQPQPMALPVPPQEPEGFVPRMRRLN